MSLINARSTHHAEFCGSPPASSLDARDVTVTTSPRWVKRTCGRWTWHVRADFQAVLDREAAPDWLKLADDPRAALVKTNDGRDVWRVPIGSQVVFVKVARPARRWARLRRLCFGSDAQREWRCADYAARHGIPAVEPLACAYAPVRGRDPSSILITAAVPAARPLNEYWLDLQRTGASRADRRALIDAVAQLIARAHAGGFEHYDLHAGNVLVALDAGRSPRVFFVDLNNVHVGRTVGVAQVARNLAQFNQWFRQNAPVADRIRFLHRYLHWRDAFANEGCGPAIRSESRDLLKLLDRAVGDHARALYAKRDRRALRTGRYFARVSLPNGWRGHVFLQSKHRTPGSRASELTFTAQQWRDWLASPPDWCAPSDRRRLIKDSASAIVCRSSLPVQPEPLEVICKRSTPRSFVKRAQNLVRASRPMRTWCRAHALLHRQIPTARPLAVLERRRCGLVVDSILITEYIEHASDLDTLLTVKLRELPPERQRWLKREVIRSLAAVMRRLLDRGFVHCDFKAPNIIVQWNGAFEHSPRVLLIDLDGLRSVRSRRAAELRMLMRLNVSLDHIRRVTRTDRLRFLLAYLRTLGNPHPDYKAVWRCVEAMSVRKRDTRSRSQEKKFEKYGRF